MQLNLKKILRALSLDLRHTLEGFYDNMDAFHPGDLETRLNALGVWRDRAAKPLDELPYLPVEDKTARKVIDAYIAYRTEAEVNRSEAIAEFVRESAYNWANRLLALRCMEARGIIDEVILQKEIYGGRSLVHNRLARKNPEDCAGPDEGLFAMLFQEFEERACELPELFVPTSPAIALRPSLPAVKRCLAVLSGLQKVSGQEAATDEVFSAPDALGWAYQYWNTEEKDRVFEKVRTQKGVKIEGADIIPATQLYTEPYMVKFLVQNSLGATWMSMHPDSKLDERWEYYVTDADRAPTELKAIEEITLLDPACGSGHFLLEAFDLFFPMYREEQNDWSDEQVVGAILNSNLYGIDIDERAVQIATAALWMKAKEYAPDLKPESLTSFHHHLVATNIRLPKGQDHLKSFLTKHPEAAPLQPALEAIFDGLENVHELGSLVQIEEPVEKELRFLREKYESAHKRGVQANLFEPTVIQGELPLGVENYEQWKDNTLTQVEQHFTEEGKTAEAVQSFFSKSAQKGLTLFDVLSRRYDIVTANPPYMGSKNLGKTLNRYLNLRYSISKYDMYTAFIHRALDLINEKGSIAFVTMQSFLYTNRFEDFREYLFSNFNLPLALHLGANAFPEMKDHVVAVCTIWHKKELSQKNTLVIDVRNYLEKPLAIKRSLDKEIDCQVSFNTEKIKLLPGMPFLYDLPDSFFSMFKSMDRIEHFPDIIIREGIHSKPDERFQRYFWEVCLPAQRWYVLSVGGALQKWAGLDDSLVDFEFSGIRIKQMPSPIVPSEDLYFQPGISYSDAGGSGFSCRIKNENVIFSSTGPAIIPGKNNIYPLLGYLNSTAIGFLLDSLNPGNHYKINDLKRLPFDNRILKNDEISKKANQQVRAKIQLLSNSLASREFIKPAIETSTFQDYIFIRSKKNAQSEAEIIKNQAQIDGIVYEMLCLDEQAINHITNRYRPVLISNDLPEYDIQPSASITGFGEQFLPGNIDFGDHGDKTYAEYELEALGIKNSISVEILLTIMLTNIEDFGKNKYGPTIISDEITYIVLSQLGFHWPQHFKATNLLLDGIDLDGIIPLTHGLPELTLLEHVRTRLPEEFPGGNVAALEREFQEIMGENLEKWLGSSFFKHHISQFKKRPIAWQLSSRLAKIAGGKGRKKGLDKAPAFDCLVYYHKLDHNTLTTMQSQYIRPLRQSYETELRTLDNNAFLSPDQSSRRLQLEAWIDELKDFESRLEQCSREGFTSPSLMKFIADEPLDRWTSRDGQAVHPTDRAEFEAQEKRYDPDINDGVRVNIAPLQKYGLLAADVLEVKDLEKAIADRAEWRADERRWCREGQLPQPGWWK